MYLYLFEVNGHPPIVQKYVHVNKTKKVIGTYFQCIKNIDVFFTNTKQLPLPNIYHDPQKPTQLKQKQA